MRQLIPVLTILAGCAQPSATTRLAMTNPASVNCQERGGQLVLRESGAGTKGYCQLTDGRSIDVWEYFRQTHP